jgi:hypothetical protein
MASEKNELSYRYWSRGPVVEPAPANMPQASVHRRSCWRAEELTALLPFPSLQKLTAEELSALEQQTKPANPAASAWNAVRAASPRRRSAVAGRARFYCLHVLSVVA